MNKDILLYSILGGILGFIMSFRDIYLSNIHHIIHINCIYLDSFVVGFFTTMICLYYFKKRISICVLVGSILGYIIGEYTLLFPLWF